MTSPATAVVVSAGAVPPGTPAPGGTNQAWCKNQSISEGTYRLADGTDVLVKQAASGRFYACQRIGSGWRYEAGLIWKLSAELDAQEMRQATLAGIGAAIPLCALLVGTYLVLS